MAWQSHLLCCSLDLYSSSFFTGAGWLYRIVGVNCCDLLFFYLCPGRLISNILSASSADESYHEPFFFFFFFWCRSIFISVIIQMRMYESLQVPANKIMYHLVIMHAYSSSFLTKTLCWCRLFNIGSPLCLSLFFSKYLFWNDFFTNKLFFGMSLPSFVSVLL